MQDSLLLDNIDLFNESCSNAYSYPTNLIASNLYEYQRLEYLQLLEQKEDEVFCNESKTAIDFSEWDEARNGFRNCCVHTKSELNDQLKTAEPQHDPRCRFIFVLAQNARDRLKADRETMMRILTYHQVMPAFLNFVLSFGSQEHPKDFHYSGFHSDTRSIDENVGFELLDLNRSGQELKVCYNLRSVEPSDMQVDWPWSIRQCAIYNSFDFVTGVTTWIIIKPNKLIRNRLRALVESKELFGPDASTFSSTEIKSVLAVHELICSWATENWRWYINFLEERLQRESRGSLTENLNRQNVSREFSRYLAEHSGAVYGSNEKQDPHYSAFENLQEVHFIEERANELLLVLRGNIDVADRLKACYSGIVTAPGAKLDDQQRRHITRFEKKLEGFQQDLLMQRSRAETLSKLVSDRRNLLQSLLQHRSIQMSQLMALKAHLSVQNMEVMTQSMQSIARSTRLDTVSMRVVTVVTLFYLPGTFISTLMSTPVVEYRNNDFSDAKRYINPDAIQLFVEMSLPLLAVTVGVCLLFSWYEGRKQRNSDWRDT